MFIIKLFVWSFPNASSRCRLNNLGNIVSPHISTYSYLFCICVQLPIRNLLRVLGHSSAPMLAALNTTVLGDYLLNNGNCSFGYNQLKWRGELFCLYRNSVSRNSHHMECLNLYILNIICNYTVTLDLVNWMYPQLMYFEYLSNFIEFAIPIIPK